MKRLFVAIIAVSASSPALPRSADDAFKAYIFCVLGSAVEFSKTAEPAEVVAKAAETKCAKLRDAAIDKSVADLKKSGPPPRPVSDQELRRLAEEYVTVRIRDEAILKVIEARIRAGTGVAPE